MGTCPGKPETFTLDGGATIELDYDGDQNRIRKTTPDEVTLYVGDLYERVTRLAPDAGEPSVEHRYSVLVNGRAVALVTRAGGALGTTLYLHRDNLGSIDVITDGSGGVHERRSYQAWGNRRQPTWDSAAPGSFGSSPVRQGFTGHEGDDELGLVNMRGRMYDPVIGRFLTPDPLVANPLSGQSFNPYSYVLNNPLAYVDPNGFQEAPAEDQDGSQQPAVEHIPWEKTGWAPEEIAVGKRPEQAAPSDADANTTGAEVGVIAPPIDVNSYGPIDVNSYGTSSGYVPEPAPSTPQQSTLGSVVGDSLLGAGEGLGELTVELGRSLVLSTLTFGAYGTYEFGTAMWDGYKEDGLIGALNAVNPMYHILRAGTDAVLAAERGDHRAASAAGTKATVLTLGAAVGLGEGLAALGGRAGAAGATTARGTVLLDSNVVAQIGKDATLAGRPAPGERGVVSYVTGPELRNAVARGSLRGVPRALEGLPVLNQRPSVDGIINFRGGLVRQTGRFGDGIIGSQSVEFGIPLITNDAELAAAVRAAGGVVR
ncbi:RHS repeat-associated core domain-containing protein [Sorangium sp. So ce1128]